MISASLSILDFYSRGTRRAGDRHLHHADDSYLHSGGTLRQARGLDGKGQRPTISGQIQDRVQGN
ncbi:MULTISPECIES: hypothetical protein [unclassified Nostoc]|uniref:hypothetical protein n=1 Tax=unclassified Nostoc TaxID=2593658 RepID=UPI002AD55499|nr:hypothetical protein [Nostoc sp. DedQUE03]MDZ7975194.1 hypothetical protein [Nostoc sp. DedQUE03]MDZ8048810.1 hypothetical protein [Nostoc sp. DedQUE02]